MQDLKVEPLTRDGFAPYGDVVGTEGAEIRLINNGTTQRFHDLAGLDAAGEDARLIVSIFRGQPFELPVRIEMMERHPLGSQAFMPLHERPWLVVVAADEDGRPGTPRAFLVEPDHSGVRGINYARNVWHHPLIALQRQGDFLVVDRDGAGNNLEEYTYPSPYRIAAL